jgi:hypothetical protein
VNATDHAGNAASATREVQWCTPSAVLKPGSTIPVKVPTRRRELFPFSPILIPYHFGIGQDRIEKLWKVYLSSVVGLCAYAPGMKK